MGVIAMVAYRPKEGGEDALVKLLTHHVPTLRKLGLASDRECLVMKSANGTYIEVFEWHSPEAVEDAHENMTVTAMWLELAEIADYEPLKNLAECAEPFAHFQPVD